jgi:pyruvyltransferase
VKAFWWTAKPNFGDALGPLLLEHFADLPAELAAPAEAEVVVCGSAVEHLPAGFTGGILGIGKAKEATVCDLSAADVRALRGPLTLRASKAPAGITLADPGLLAPLLLAERPEPRHALGIVPHFNDPLLVADFPGALLIDVRDHPLAVIRAIGSCRQIVASSLHGLIVADAFAIPRVWRWFPGIQGAGFKFYDYGLSIREDLRPGRLATADAGLVRALQGELRGVFADYGAIAGGFQRHCMGGAAGLKVAEVY